MKEAAKPEDFITALLQLQEDCGVADLKMSDYGFIPGEYEMLAKNARDTMGGLFHLDPSELSDGDCVSIFKAAYK